MAKELKDHYWNRILQHGNNQISDSKLNYIRMDRFWRMISYETDMHDNKPIIDEIIWQFNDMDDFYHYIRIDKQSYKNFMAVFKNYPAYLKILYFQSYMSTSYRTNLKDSLDLCTDDCSITIDATLTGQPLYYDDYEVKSKLICRRCSGIKEEERSIIKLFKKLDNYFKEAE